MLLLHLGFATLFKGKGWTCYFNELLKDILKGPTRWTFCRAVDTVFELWKDIQASKRLQSCYQSPTRQCQPLVYISLIRCSNYTFLSFAHPVPVWHFPMRFKMHYTGSCSSGSLLQLRFSLFFFFGIIIIFFPVPIIPKTRPTLPRSRLRLSSLLLRRSLLLLISSLFSLMSLSQELC